MKTTKYHLDSIVIAVAIAVLAVGCSREAKEARHLQRADRHFKAGEFDKAKIEYMNVLKYNPGRAHAFQQIGTIWMEQGDPLLAAQFLSKARDLAPNDLDVRSKLGSACLASGDLVSARKEALAILDRAPANDEAILMLADTTRTREDAGVTAQRLGKVSNQETASFQLASAGLLFRNSDRAGGEAAMQRALALDPKNPEVHLRLGIGLVSQREMAKATEEFKKAAELSPPRGRPRLKYAEFKFQSGAIEEAKAIAKEITGQTPDYLPAWLLQARIAFAEKKLDEALSLVAQVLMRDGSNLDAHILQSRLWLAKGDAKKAIREMEGVNPAYAGLPSVKFQLALGYLQDNDTSNAIASLNQAIAANPDYVDAQLLLAETNLRMKNPQPVIPAMSRLLKAQPDLARAKFLLADAYRLLGKFDDAAGVYRDQIKRNPQDAQAYFMLGTILRNQRNPTEARAAFEKAQELAPQDLAVTDQLVELDFENKSLAEALKRVEAQIQTQPQSAPAWYLKGRVCAASKDWPNAEAALTKTLELNPNATHAYDLLTAVYISQGKGDQAIEEVQTALAKNPTNVLPLVLLGNLYETKKQYQKADETYERLLSIKPDFGPALNNLAYSYAERRHDLDKALDYAKRAHTLLPDDARTTDTLGWILFRRGDYKQALSLLQDAASNLQGMPEVSYHLGMASYMMNEREAARVALQEAARSPVDFPGKEEIASRLALLGDDAGKPAEHSLEELEALLQQHPDDLQVRIALGGGLEKKGDWAKAAETYESVLSRNAALLEPTLKLAQLNDGPLKNPEKALQLARKARELAPSDPQVAATAGGIAFRSGSFPLAYGLLQDAILPMRVIRNQNESLDTGAAAALHDFAWAAYVMGKVPEARDAMKRLSEAAQATPYAEDASTFRAMLDLEEHPRESVEVEAEVGKILEAKPDYIPALIVRNWLRAKKGQVQESVADLTALLKRYPDLAPAQKLLASIYLQDPAKLAAAYDLAAKAHKSLPDDPELSRLLANISYQRKEYPYAIQLFRESARKQPLDAQSLYVLGLALRETGQKVQSRETLQQALTSGLPPSLSSEATRIVAELGKK